MHDEKHVQHGGCVNTVSWGDNMLVLSGGDDRQLFVSDALSGKIIHRIETAHVGNIFSARFLPNSRMRKIVSCAKGGTIEYDDLDEPELLARRLFKCHLGSVYDICVIPNNAYSFLSCGEDGTVRLHDLRKKTSCDGNNCTHNVIVRIRGTSTCALQVCPTRPYELAVGCADGTARIYDMRRTPLGSADATGIVGLRSLCPMPIDFFAQQCAEATLRPRRVTSVAYSKAGNELLVNFSGDTVCLYDLTVNETSEHKVQIERLLAHNTQSRPRRIIFSGNRWSDTGPESVIDRAPSTAGEGGERRLPEDHVISIDNLIANLLIARRILTQENRDADDNSEYHTDNGGTTSSSSSSSSAEYESARSSLSASPKRDSTVEPARTENSETNAERCTAANNDNIRKVFFRLLQHLPQNRVVEVFSGHRNCRTMFKEAVFWGRRHVMAGSDCGHLFIWRRPATRVTNVHEVPAPQSGTVIYMRAGDAHVINCVQPHPTLFMCITSGIEYKPRIWRPSAKEHFNDYALIEQVMKSNKQMAKKALDTVSIPGSVLARLFHLAGSRRVLEQHREQQQGQSEAE